jgi:hypothetical protein
MHDPHAVRIRAEVVERLAEFVHTKKAKTPVVAMQISPAAEEKAS